MHFESLGPYRILEEQERTAAGRRFVASDTETERRVAIQCFDILADLDEDERAAAQDRLLAACGRLVGREHPNLVALLDIDEHEGVPYFVTEHVEGESCDAFCEPGRRLPAGAAIEVAVGAARGLAELHRANLIHGDVRPGTLVRCADGVKVSGLGLAAVGLADASRYQSPEQVRRESCDGRSDLFSLGTVLYELLVGRPAFAGKTPSAVLYRIVNDPIPDLRALDPPLHDAVAAILLRLLAKAREDRPADGDELAESLAEANVALEVDATLGSSDVATADEPPPVEPRPVAPPPRVQPKRTRLRPFLLAASLIALVAVGFVLLQRGRTPAPPPAVWLETRVRTEPPGIPVLEDGEPLETNPDGVLRFREGEPFSTLSASHECRTAEHLLSAADAGGDVVLVLDPVSTEVQVDPRIDGARLSLNGESIGATPATASLDLCRTNRLELEAPGHRAAGVELPAGSTPLEARTLAYGLALEPLPKGRLALPATRGLQLVYYLDGKRLDGSVRELELEEGRYRLRYKNDFHWLDVTVEVEVEGGETTTPSIEPKFGKLVVQAYPSNCKVFARKPGGSWSFIDEAPAERRVAVGSYEVRVELVPTGESRVETVNVAEGANPPLRISFGASR